MLDGHSIGSGTIRAGNLWGYVMALVLKILQCLAIIMAAVMFAAAFDIGHFGLKEMISPFAIGPVVLFAILSIVPVFLSAKSSGGDGDDNDALAEKLTEVQAKVNSRLAAMQTKLDDMTGQDKETLAEENRQLKEQLEEIQQAERDKAASDAELLRKRNEELEEQIKQWAIESVGNTFADKSNAEEAA
ncbi:MAG: hypothetical protein ABJM29_10830 [Rhizobiaceae bacterium]